METTCLLRSVKDMIGLLRSKQRNMTGNILERMNRYRYLAWPRSAADRKAEDGEACQGQG